MSRSNRQILVQILVVLTLASLAAVTGCGDDLPDPTGRATETSEGTGGTPGTPDTRSTTTTPDAADTTAGEPILCADALGDNGTLATAYALTLDATNDHRTALEAALCPGESDFLRYEPPCPGHFGVEVVVDEAGDDVTLLLRDETGTELQRSEGYPELDRGAFRMEALHRIVDTDALVIEVQHEAGAVVPYAIVAYFLPTGSCMEASWACEATASLVAFERPCAVEPILGQCPSPEGAPTPVSLPRIGTGPAAFSGWIVTTPADAVQYRARPTREELAAIEARCREACQAEWASDPSIVVDCEDPDGFETPYLFPGLD
jgi:hypothetical protein